MRMDRRRLSISFMVIGWLAFGASSVCYGASSTDELGGSPGIYAAADAAPDSLTSTKSGASLKVTGGSAAPEYVADQGVVQLTSMSGGTAVFSGRTTCWGCAYSVSGIYVTNGNGGSGQPPTWSNSFGADGPAHVVLNVNGSGGGDNGIAFGSNGGTLTVSVAGGSSSTSYTISLSDSPSGTPGGDVGFSSSSVTVSGGGSASVTLSGLAKGGVIITASCSNPGSSSCVTGASVSATVVCSACADGQDGAYDDCVACSTNNGNGGCFRCDTNGDGIRDSCDYRCDTNDDGVLDTCYYTCDTNGDNIKDACNSCDSNGDGVNDDCFGCDTNSDGIPDGCATCDNDGDGAKDTCGFGCDTDGNTTLDGCYMCDTNGDGYKDDCYSCDTNNDTTPDACVTDTELCCGGEVIDTEEFGCCRGIRLERLDPDGNHYDPEQFYPPQDLKWDPDDECCTTDGCNTILDEGPCPE